MLSHEQLKDLKQLLLDNQKEYDDQLENFKMGTLEDSSQRGSVGEPRRRFSTPSIFGWSSGVVLVHRAKHS